MRSPILSSWQRSRLLGLSPDQSELPFEQDIDLEGPLLRAAEPVLDRLQAIFAGSQTNISLADGHGMVLARRFGEKSMVRRLAPIQILPGFVFAERFAGTNGIGLSLAERRLCQVYGAEHFAERSQASACTAIPLRDQLSGHILGVLCLGYPYTDADPALIPVVRKAAEAIERRLMDQPTRTPQPPGRRPRSGPTSLPVPTRRASARAAHHRPTDPAGPAGSEGWCWWASPRWASTPSRRAGAWSCSPRPATASAPPST
ncbi:GAF domain-containing protein [Streptomyces virginiae]|uniref:GAF domain-containing protein n=1 Tax=Streptomyces virginiae TaxID=1961 RepID=UPI0032C215C2